MPVLTIFGACAVSIMLLSYALERRFPWWILVFGLACAASSVYGWMPGTWPFGVVEGIWCLVVLRRWWLARTSGIASKSHLELRLYYTGHAWYT
jgi:hypothetical protein